jgi:hypothetical protein
LNVVQRPRSTAPAPNRPPKAQCCSSRPCGEYRLCIRVRIRTR